MSFSYYRSVTIDHTQCGSSNSINFPVLFNTTNNSFKTVGNGGKVQNSNGYDIRPYSDSSLTIPLTFELERYNASTGEVVMWINVPTVSSSTDTVIYIAYGDASISSDGSSAATWNSNFKGVWHLKDGTTLSLIDIIGNNNLTNSGATATAGQIDGGAAFNGSSQYASKTSSVTSLPAMNATVTMSVWFTIGVADGTDRSGVTLTDSNGFFQFAQHSSTVGFWKGGPTAIGATQANPTINTLHHMVLTYDGTTNRAYYDGTALTTDTVGHDAGTVTAIYFSTYNAGAQFWNGILDDVRISDSVRSADWILTEYNNQKTSSTFYSLGSEITVGGSTSMIAAGISIIYIPGPRKSQIIIV